MFESDTVDVRNRTLGEVDGSPFSHTTEEVRRSMNGKSIKILIIDDDEDVLSAARLYLKQHFRTVITEKNPERIPGLLAGESYDVILLDMNFTRDLTSGREGFDWLGKILEIDPDAVVVMITAWGDVDLAVKAIKSGATDFVLKPWENEKLLATLTAAAQLRLSRRENETLRDRQQLLSEDLDQPFFEIIGNSSAIRQIFHTIQKLAKTDANILILGENGTGKELVARALHRHSSRASQIFLSVDMGAISETLFESELFGHVKGAFTDARTERRGRFEVATGGTLFLDEIGNLPFSLQSKLLKAIETRSITPVGSNKLVPIDIRLICATNTPLYEMVSHNEFRQDLLYRINTVEIALPPLRERIDDIPLLAEHFLQLYTKKYKRTPLRISHGAIRKMQRYPWPGNIRELKHSIERAVILTESAVLEPEDLLLSTIDGKSDGLHFDTFHLEEVEKSVIQKAIEKHRGNISHAAKELGLTRASLYRRMEKYSL
jgi:two-component system, NtrC family, response regulator HydG